jgi:hypothetical protein
MYRIKHKNARRRGSTPARMQVIDAHNAITA